MTFSIAYHEKVVKEDIPRLSVLTRKRVKRAIEDKLSERPEVFGKPLRKSLTGYRKLRVGDYRIVLRIEKSCVMIFAIMNRSEVYKAAGKRLSSL